ncbi:MAG: ATP-binding cassette domain-containing protein, partial [Planctomycetia bacterium]
MRCADLLKTFGEGDMKSTAVNGVSLSLNHGEIALLMGPSGSGKTTLLAMLSGLLRPNGGKVVALGSDIWNMSELDRERFRRKHCSFIFQGYNLFASLTARQQLEIVARWG